jgi:kynurenine 3-monooxygenase
MPQRIHIVGGGLVGPLAAIVLAQKGLKVALHERRPDMRRVDIPAGRSINLAVTARGLKALEEVGLKENILAIALPMRGRMLHDMEGKTTFVPYGQKESEVINSVSRGSLNKVLLDKADSYENVEIAFNQHCVAYDLDASTLTFVNDETGQSETISADVILGADGAWSVIRKTMLESVKDFNYSQEFLEHGYKELHIPPAPGGGFRLEKNALHIWPRKSFMLIALPNLDGSFTCTLFFAHQGAESFAALRNEHDVQAFFARVFPDAVPLMPTLTQDFFSNPTGSMVTVKCKPWHVEGKAMLLGDAAHAIVPFFGQGMNCGFEDCSELGELLEKNGVPRWTDLFDKLEARRKPNADAIADMALENFVEMRDTVADPKFQLKKQIGFELERRYPGQFIPRYAMVVFHPEIPYADARRRSEIQDKILEELCIDASSLDQINWEKADQLIRQRKY